MSDGVGDIDVGSFFCGFISGIMVLCLVLWLLIPRCINPNPKVIGFDEVGYHAKYKGQIYKLTPHKTCVDETFSQKEKK